MRPVRPQPGILTNFFKVSYGVMTWKPRRSGSELASARFDGGGTFMSTSRMRKKFFARRACAGTRRARGRGVHGCATCQHCVGRWPVCPSAIAEVLYDAEVDMEAEVPTTAAVADIRRCGKPTSRGGKCKVILKPSRKCPYHG